MKTIIKPKKSKPGNYTVTLLARCDVLVIGVKDEAQAIEFANSEASNGDFEVLEQSANWLSPDADLEDERRHADVVSEADND